MSKIVLYAMTEKGFEVAHHFVRTAPEVLRHVVIGRDSGIEDDYSHKLDELCSKNGIPFSFRGDMFTPDADDYALAVSWRWLIDHPVEKLIVFHDSLLPKYRGFAPLVNALIKGEKEIGVTALFGASEYDKGDIIAQKKSTVSYPIKIAGAITQNNKNYVALAEEIGDKIAAGKTLKATPQKEAEATYSIWRDEEDYRIDWHQDAETVLRMIDALGTPYGGARTMTDGQEIIVDEAEVVPDVVCELRHPGKVIFMQEGCPVIICGTGLLKITKGRVLEEGRELPLLPLKRFRIRLTSP